MAYTKNPQWKDYPDESTPVTAERLNHLEDGVYAAAATADSAVAGLSGKADTGHTHTAGDVSGLATVATSGSYDDLDDKPSIPSTPGDIGAAAASHQHAAGDITSGTIAPARLGSGTADNTRFLRGDGTWQVPPTGDGGVTDHGALTGLSDDDHPQYHNDERGDARYYTKTQVDDALSGKSNTGHTHSTDDITGLADVATSGDYDDLENKPSIPSTPGDIGAAASSHSHTADHISDATNVGKGVLTAADAAAARSAIGAGTSSLSIGTTDSTAAAGNRGLPTGGTEGQVLAKASGSNYDTEWVDPPETQDTGELNINALVDDTKFYRDWGMAVIRRIGNIVVLVFDVYSRSSESKNADLFTLPVGFRPTFVVINPVAAADPPVIAKVQIIGGVPGIDSAVSIKSAETLGDGQEFSITLTYTTSEPWPTTLPGTPV